MEQWVPIKGHPDYEVSSHGRIRRVVAGQNGHKPGIIKGSLDASGYFYLNLRHQCGGCPKVHRLVAVAFLPNPLLLPVVNHKDGNKQHNHVSNLEWCTHQENVQHAYDTGLKSNQGSKHPQAILNEESIKQIKSMIKGGTAYKHIAGIFTVSYATIWAIAKGKRWAHVDI